jgi:hypothetical protein
VAGGDALDLVLGMPARVTLPDPRVGDRGCAALERSPLVTVETADVPAGIELEDVALPAEPPYPAPTAGPRTDLGRPSSG